MPYHLYLSSQNDNKISVFGMDTETGRLSPTTEVAIPDGPSQLSLSQKAIVVSLIRFSGQIKQEG